YRWRFIVPLNPANISPPTPPSDLDAAIENNQATLTWNAAPDAGVLSYSVYRSTTPGTGYSLIASNLTETVHIDTDLTPEVTYYYVTTMTDWMGRESAYSNEATVAPGSPLPIEPTTIDFATSEGNVVLSWPSNYIGWLLQVQTNAPG